MKTSEILADLDARDLNVATLRNKLSVNRWSVRITDLGDWHDGPSFDEALKLAWFAYIGGLR